MQVMPTDVEGESFNSSRKQLPKFTYHKVHNSSGGAPESNFWKRMSLMNRADSPQKRKTFVAVSILPDSGRDSALHRVRKEKKRQNMHRMNVNEKHVQNYHKASKVLP